jgi:integrase
MRVTRDGDAHCLRAVVNGYSVNQALKATSAERAAQEAATVHNRWRRRLKNLYLRGDRWYVVAMVHGKRLSKSLDLDAPEWPVARIRARALLRQIKADKWSILTDLSSRKPKAAAPVRISECVEIYERQALIHSLRRRTVQDYIASLRLVLGVKDLNIPCSAATRTAVQEYVARSQVARGDNDSTRRSIRSTVAQARKIFSQWALDDYRAAGLNIPDSIDGFLKCWICKPAPVFYRWPEHSLIQRTHEAAKRLRGPNNDLWAVYLLTYHLALRAGEAAAVRWSWFDTDQTGRRWLRIEAREGEWVGPKGTYGKVPVAGEVWAWLQDIRCGLPYVLPAETKTARKNLVGRSFAAWMRGLGWTCPKAAHELRKLRGSEWYTAHGVEVAASWLRHTDPGVTARYYGDLAEQPELV